jgi:PAS domain S-box-containing protein
MLCCPYVPNVVQAIIAAIFLRRFSDTPWQLNTLRNMAVFILVAVIAAPAIASLAAAWLFVVVGWETNFLLVAEARFLNNVITGLTVAPLIFACSRETIERLRRVLAPRCYEFAAVLLGLATVLAVISIFPSAELRDLPWELYAPIPFLVWAAVRYGPAELSFSLLIVAAHSIYQTINSHGAFVEGSAAQNVLSLEISLAVLSVPLMLLSSLIEEGRDKSRALVESEARFRTMADTAPVFIWMSGPDKLCNFFSKGWLFLTGRSMDRLLGNAWLESVHPEDRESCVKNYEEAFSKWRQFVMEYRLRRHDGEYRSMLQYGVPRFSPDGAFLGYIGSAVDITERKQAELRLRVQHEVTRILSEASSMAEAGPQILRAICGSLGWQLGELWRVQRDTNVMVWANGWHSPSPELKEFATISARLTYSPGMGLPGLVWKSREPQWIRDFLNDENFLRVSLAVKTGLRAALGFPIFVDDEVLGAMVFVGRDLREAEPELLEMLSSVGRQIGQFIDRQQAEAALRISEEQLAQARASSFVMVTHSDLKGRWLQVPPSLCRLLGYTEAELIGHSIAEVTHPADIEENLRQRARLLRREIRSFDLEKRYIKKDGNIVWVYLNVSAVTDANGTPQYCLSYINDITERKRTENALRESDLRLRLAMDAARIGYWEVELETGRIIGSELDRVFGISWPETREDFFALVHPDDRQEVKAQAARATESLTVYDIEYRIMRSDGKLRWVASRGQVLPDAEGHPCRIVGLSTDITDHKESQQALQSTLGELQKLRERVEAENVYLRSEVARTHRYDEIIGQTEGMQHVLRLVDQVAPTDVTVLIQGETGTGKELIARAVHAKSGRSDRPLVTVNCSALPAELIESELFGHEKGSFTGAIARQVGRFELADGGTIFLDEIGELPLNLQIKLLRVLQEGEFERIGSASTIKVNVRVIAATNRNLPEAIHNGSFRADLYYRLNVYPISLPPLRDRKQDIVRLATAFLREASAKLGKRFDRLPAAVVMVLESYDWPGNVRELQNAIERAAVISAGDALQLPEDWQPSVVERQNSTPSPSLDSLPSSDRDKVERVTLEDLERRHILRVLGETGWKVEGPRGAATILGLPPNTLRSRMKKLGIPTKRSQQNAEVPSRLRTH